MTRRRLLGRDDGEIAPADFGHFLAHADDTPGPIQQRLRIAALDRHCSGGRREAALPGAPAITPQQDQQFVFVSRRETG